MLSSFGDKSGHMNHNSSIAGFTNFWRLNPSAAIPLGHSQATRKQRAQVSRSKPADSHHSLLHASFFGNGPGKVKATEVGLLCTVSSFLTNVRNCRSKARMA